MKNDKFIESVQKIMPDEAHKDRLLSQAYDRLTSSESQVKKVYPIKRTMKWFAPVAACFVIVLAAVSIPNLFNQSPGILPLVDNSQIEQGDNNTLVENPTSGESEMREIPRWNDMHITNQFSWININGLEYTTNSLLKIDPYQIGELIGRTTSIGYDVYETAQNGDKRGKEHTIICEVYAIKSISSGCAVAVKYEGHDGYYPFINWLYKPDTLGDLINDLNLVENLVFTNNIYYSFWKDNKIENGNYITMNYRLPDTSVIWDMVLSDISVKNVGDGFYGLSVMDISIDTNVLGDKNISLSVTEEGYLTTNILSTQKAFFIGKDKVQAFVDYVLENGTGILLEPDNETINPEAEEIFE